MTFIRLKIPGWLLFALVRGNNQRVTTRPAQRPEGALIQGAAERTRQSARQLAANAGISDARWRHIVNGYQPVGRGEAIAVVAPSATLARMARVVGVSSDQLRQVGRSDAADVLEATDQASPPRTEDEVVDDLLDQIWASGISGDKKLKLIKVLMRAEKTRQAVAEELRAEQESA